jgi:hypothetical protein
MGNGEGNFWMFIFDEEKVCCLWNSGLLMT